MGADDHKRGDKKKGFCTIPAETKCDDCPGSKNYIEVCKPSWAGHTFERTVNAEGGAFVFDKKYEAHHLVCVAPATDELLGNSKIKGAIEQTVWCINNGDNMLGMPLWGHTVKWYCSFSRARGKVKGELNTAAKAPPFKDIPMHDFDHNNKLGYTPEVTDAVIKLAMQIEQKGHKLSGDTLVGALKRLSGKFKTTLKERGERKGGTHEGWKLGLKGDDDWCHPFSMASTDNISKVGFPAKDFDSKLDRWIDRIANAIAGA